MINKLLDKKKGRLGSLDRMKVPACKNIARLHNSV